MIDDTREFTTQQTTDFNQRLRKLRERNFPNAIPPEEERDYRKYIDLGLFVSWMILMCMTILSVLAYIAGTTAVQKILEGTP